MIPSVISFCKEKYWTRFECMRDGDRKRAKRAMDMATEPTDRMNDRQRWASLSILLLQMS